MQLSPSCSLSQRDNIQLLTIDNHHARAEISLFGGHLLSFIPKHDQQDRLWLSEAAIFDGKQAIRGGVPVCWPWFGDHPQKATLANPGAVAAHGYVRTQTWHIVSTTDNNDATQVILQPQTTTGEGFDGAAELSLIIDIGRHCSLQLKTTNIGNTGFIYRCALHSYFAVKHIEECQLSGLVGDYLDKTRGMQKFTTPSDYRFSAETDRVHLCQAQHLTINNGDITRTIRSAGHDSIVVWNPWQDKSKAMKDMRDEGYLSMLCVETAVTQGQMVAAGESHILQQIIE